AYVLRPLPRRAERSSRVGRSDRPQRPSSNERRLGARIQAFGACSGFTRVAARTLADPPKTGLCPQGFDGLVALAVSRVATQGYLPGSPAPLWDRLFPGLFAFPWRAPSHSTYNPPAPYGPPPPPPPRGATAPRPPPAAR